VQTPEAEAAELSRARGADPGWTSTPVVSGALLGVAAPSAFVGWARASAHPVPDLTLFRNPRFSAASAALALSLFAMTGQLFILSQYLQMVRGLSPAASRAVPGTHVGDDGAVGVAICPCGGTLRHEDRADRRAAGCGQRAGRAAAARPESAFGTVIADTVLLGVGLSPVMPPATASIVGSLPERTAGVGAAVNETARQVGAALGVAVLASLASARYSSTVTSRLGDLTVPDTEGPAIGRDLAGALSGTDGWGGERGRHLAHAARASFSSGMHLAMAVGAGVMAIAAVSVMIWLPGRASDASSVALDETASGQPEVATG
jgi:hypothetical protein